MSQQTIHHMPVTEFGRTLLLSIPKKVMFWVQRLCQQSHSLDGASTEQLKTSWRDGVYKDLAWTYHDTQLQRSCISFDEEEPVEIWWEGTFNNMYTPRGTEEWFKDIENNMDKFVALEQRIYGLLEEMEEEITREVEKRNLQASSAS